MSITGIVEANTVKLPDGVSLPDGTAVRIEPVTEFSSEPFASRYTEFIGVVKDGPADLSDKHDEHLNDTAKNGG